MPRSPSEPFPSQELSHQGFIRVCKNVIKSLRDDGWWHVGELQVQYFEKYIKPQIESFGLTDEEKRVLEAYFSEIGLNEAAPGVAKTTGIPIELLKDILADALEKLVKKLQRMIYS